MEVVLGSEIVIKNPTKELLEWCHQFLEIANPDYTKRMRMGLWVGQTPKTIYLYKVKGNELYLPYGLLRSVYPAIKDCPMQSKFHPKRPIFYNDKFRLEPYQEKAVETLMQKKSGLLKAPAGSGKTHIGLALIARLGLKALWLVHTKDLLKQAYDRAVEYMDKRLLGITSEGKIEFGEGITFATVQTMARVDPNEYRHAFDMVVVDECHRVVGTPIALGQFAKVLNNVECPYKIGMSATIHRADGLIKSLFAYIGPLVCEIPESETAQRIMKAEIIFRGLDTPESFDYLGADGVINHTALLEYLVSNKERTYAIADDIEKELEAGHSCIVLSDRLNHLDALQSALPAKWRALSIRVSGKNTKAAKLEREQGQEEMRQGKKKVMFATYQLAKEGLDIPILDRLFLATPHKDYSVITQAVGRVCRRVPNKGTPKVFDYVDENIVFLARAFRTRCTTYRKGGHKIIG